MREFQPVRTRSVAGDVVGQIVDRLKSGELIVGDILPGERVLAAQMDVSRPTVSAAMARLADAGVLRRRPGRQGNAEIISIWIPEDLVEKPAAVGELEADDIFRVLEARKTLEPRIAQLAAFRATDDDFAALQNSIDLLAANRDDITKAEQAELLFHRIMWRTARNASLQSMMLGLEKELAPIHDMMLRTPEDYAAGIELHTATLAALKRGEPAEIEEEMYRHLGHFEAIVVDVLQRTPHRQMPAFLLAGTN
ncbi:FadR/GntR family transcriptional regulator [Mycobacterium sp. GA-2829]|uniref:FadR/GntR family transcriptional regulator n=1 Tax=Mycobacterium sp. GA-2829 TaxID=1772283 RepID=UPI0007404037|nr:FCD domain-containing protein [Mycobacterium sp. GA-2829]KUI29314.1 GntR family transcriptional regulator [Mycobacterium sp. GA-2829]